MANQCPESWGQVLILSAINEISIVNNKKSYESVDIPQNIWAFERIIVPLSPKSYDKLPVTALSKSQFIWQNSQERMSCRLTHAIKEAWAFGITSASAQQRPYCALEKTAFLLVVPEKFVSLQHITALKL